MGKDVGTMYKSNTFGEGSSPALYGDKIVVQQDHERGSSLLLSTSGQVMSSGRPTAMKEQHGRPLLLLNTTEKHKLSPQSTNRIRSYDLETGENCMGG